MFLVHFFRRILGTSFEDRSRIKQLEKAKEQCSKRNSALVGEIEDVRAEKGKVQQELEAALAAKEQAQEQLKFTRADKELAEKQIRVLQSDDQSQQAIAALIGTHIEGLHNRFKDNLTVHTVATDYIEQIMYDLDQHCALSAGSVAACCSTIGTRLRRRLRKLKKKKG